jgi:hypothetical protein
MAGLPRWAAWALQIPYSILVMAGAAWLLIRNGRTPTTVALGLFAIILALPYSAIYDLALVAPALTVAMFAEQPREADAPLAGGPAVALWLAPAFAIPFGLMALPIVPATIAVMLLVALAYACGWRGTRDAAAGLRHRAAGTGA